jgi:hypothetical protein
MMAVLLMMIPPPPPFGPVRGNIDCLLEKASKSYRAMIELNQEDATSQVVLRGLGLAPGTTVTAVDLDAGEIVGRNVKGETQFQLTPAGAGKWGGWWRYVASGTHGVCYGNLYGAQTTKAQFTSVASIEVN